MCTTEEFDALETHVLLSFVQSFVEMVISYICVYHRGIRRIRNACIIIICTVLCGDGYFMATFELVMIVQKLGD